MKQSFAPVVKKAAPAVVNVYVRHRVETMVSPFFNDPFFGRLFGEHFGIPRERIENSLGSGVLASPDGFVVTNNHVIQGSGEAEITVALSDGREFPAKVMLKDEQSDLAVLRLDAKGVQFPSIEFSDSDSLEVGDLVLAIGDPFGVGQTVTSGIVSALARTQVGISELSVLHPDRRRHQSRQFGRRAGGHGWAAGRHQHRHLSPRAAARTASALPFPPTWCGSWFSRRSRAARCSGPGSAPRCSR